MKCSTVVAIGVERRGVGRDNSRRWSLSRVEPRRNVCRKLALKGHVKVTIDDTCEEV
jgi:hypothetical protein